MNVSKSMNSSLSSKTIKRKENKYNSHKYNSINKKDKLLINIKNNNVKIRNSSNDLTLLKTNSINHANKISNKDNHIYLNTEKISTNKTNNEYKIETPINKIKINSSNQDKSTNNTKPYSTTNNEETSSSKKIESSKTKNTLLSFKIKDFSIHTNNDKKLISLKNNQPDKNNHIITSYDKKERYSHTYRNKKNIKTENIIKEATISSSGKKLINLSETQEGYINHIYKSLKSGKYQNMENSVKNYLLNMKKLDNNEVDFIINKYQYKNFRTNFSEMKNYINKQNLGKKIEKLYLNNNDYNRIEPLMDKLNKKENEIFQFENKISKIYNK